MQIDWFTTGAQVINFLILIWLLKKFLYRPVINAMEAANKTLLCSDNHWQHNKPTRNNLKNTMNPPASTEH